MGNKYYGKRKENNRYQNSRDRRIVNDCRDSFEDGFEDFEEYGDTSFENAENSYSGVSVNRDPEEIRYIDLYESCIRKEETHGPGAADFSKELERVKDSERARRIFRSTLFTLLVVTAASILVAVYLMPVLRIYGASMTPTLDDGNIILAIKQNDFETGDIIAFYYNNKILVKRAVACAGDIVNMDSEGSVYVNDVLLEEPYLSIREFGDSNIEYPYIVPAGRVFVLGDNRHISVDSRNTAVGCVAEEQIIGKPLFRVWPLAGFGTVR